MGGPAGAEGDGEVPVAGPVDLLHPGLQPGDGFLAFGRRQLPPRRRGFWVVPAGVGVGLAGCGEQGERGSMLMQGAADGGGLVGELGQPAGGSGVMLGLAGLEPGEVLGVGGELVHDGGGRVGAGHGRLQGKAVPSPGSHSAGT